MTFYIVYYIFLES